MASTTPSSSPPSPPSPWRKTSEREACPVCQDIGGRCRVRAVGTLAVGAAWCRLPELLKDVSEGGESLRTAEGWVWARHVPVGSGGVVMLPPSPGGGISGAELLELRAPDLAAERRAEAERYEALGRAKADATWRACKAGECHPRLYAYVRARGIPWDEQRPLPPSLRFHPECPEGLPKKGGLRGPAMVGRIVECIAGEGDEGPRLITTGVHRTFLDIAGEGKRAELEDGPSAKQMLGACKGRAVWLARDFSAGAVVVGEGIETVLACMAATGLPGIACLSALGVERWIVPARLLDQAPGGPVHTVIVAADRNRAVLRKPAREDLVRALAEECPGLSASVAELIAGKPTGERAAWILAARLQAARPWLSVIVKTPAAVEGQSSVDWLDVLNASEPAAVKGALLEGVDLAANAERARSWRPPSPGEEENAARTREGAGDAEGGGGDGGGDDDGWDGDAPPWIATPFEDMPILEEGALVRARRYLWEECRLVDQNGRARRFGWAWWGGKPWTYNGYCYEETDPKLAEGRVWHWLQGFRHYKGKKVVAVSPTERMAREVMSGLAVDCWVHGDEMPRWLPPVLDELGRPLWGRASAVEGREGRAQAPTLAGGREGSAKGRLIFPNGVLSFQRLMDKTLSLEERVRLDRHTPELFSTTCLPFDVPLEDLRRLLDGADRDEIYQRLCPKFYGWMADASDGDPEWEDQLLKMLGDTISLDRLLEKIFGVVGLSRGGKGIVEDAIVAIMGEDNVGGLDSATLEDRFGLAHLVGKAVALMPDAHLGSFGRGTVVEERLKSISGQGRIPIRDLYTRTTTMKLLCRIWLFMNNEPDLKDESAALAGRFIWLPITKGYAGKEDDSIKRAVPAEAPGIMLLAIEGALRLWAMPRRRIEMCVEGAQIAAGFEEDSAPLKIFRESWLTYPQQRPPEANMPTAEELYEMYVAFCVLEEHRKPLGNRKFERAMRWHARPFGWIQPEVDDKRRRRLDGWVMNPGKQRILDEWRRDERNRTTGQERQDLPFG